MNPAPESTPDQLGPYEVYERLGIGGMATVYRAKKRGPAGYERSVALKRMLSHLAEDASFVDSFVREAKVASLLVHPNIAQVYDFGRIGGVYYIAMELVTGFDVRKLLRHASRCNEPVPLPIVLSILGELCDALEYAHSFVDELGAPLNIVHRDISPSNLIVAHTGHLKVIDFGIAKASSRQLHTASGQVKGKLGYMSPEAAQGAEIGPVSDVFSMGVVAWELVTASPLFSAKTDFETMWRIREAEISPPSHKNSLCPPELDQIILAALERDPAHRLASARMFRRALDDVAARANLQVSPRTVAEWLLHVGQPGDLAKQGSSGRTSLPEMVTSVLQPSAVTPLRRSEEDIKLATEIWGEDVAPVLAGPDFSSANILPSTTDATRVLAPEHAASAAWRSSTSRDPVKVNVRRRVIAALVVIAAALGGVVYWQHSQATEDHDSMASQASGSRGATQDLPTTTQVTQTPATQTPATQTPATQTPAIKAGETSLRRKPIERPRAKPPRALVANATNSGESDGSQTAAVSGTSDPEPPAKVEPTDRTPVVHVPARSDTPTPGHARTPIVAASSVTKLSGSFPTIKGDTDGDVQIKVCIDEQGQVSSAKVLTSTVELPDDLPHALESWRYKPYLNKDNKPSPACFVWSSRVVVKRAD